MLEKKQKRTYHIDTLLTKAEYDVISLKADNYGIKKSQFTRKVSLGYPLPPCRADQRAVQVLISLHYDLNKLGNLFKMFIHSRNKSYEKIETVVNEIQETSKKILSVSEDLL